MFGQLQYSKNFAVACLKSFSYNILHIGLLYHVSSDFSIGEVENLLENFHIKSVIVFIFPDFGEIKL